MALSSKCTKKHFHFFLDTDFMAVHLEFGSSEVTCAAVYVSFNATLPEKLCWT